MVAVHASCKKYARQIPLEILPIQTVFAIIIVQFPEINKTQENKLYGYGNVNGG